VVGERGAEREVSRGGGNEAEVGRQKGVREGMQVGKSR
jgi:hypothetical protein